MNRAFGMLGAGLLAGAAVLSPLWADDAGPAPRGLDPAALAALAGELRADGSSTVFPITEAVAEEFKAVAPKVKVTVGISGTGGGFKKFCPGEIDFNDASRPIKPSEIEAAAKAGTEFIELPVAYDGLSVVVSAKNDFVTSLTVAELKRLWEPGSTVKSWSDLRAEWPKSDIHLFGPGHDSGTFDYFTEAICGKERASRADYTASEDDNVLVSGIAGDAHALGYFGYAYYLENQDKLKLVAVDAGKGPVLPSEETIVQGTYQPLSRPLFVYVSRKAAERPEVDAFVRFYLAQVPSLAHEVGYQPLPAAVYALANARFAARQLGSLYAAPAEQRTGKTLEEILSSGARN